MRQNMKKCEERDFELKGLNVSKHFEKGGISKRICPDVKSRYDKDTFYKIRNSYTNQTLRNSFSVEIMKCVNSST